MRKSKEKDLCMLMRRFTDSLFRIMTLRCKFGAVYIPVLISRRWVTGGKRKGRGRRKERRGGRDRNKNRYMSYELLHLLIKPRD